MDGWVSFQPDVVCLGKTVHKNGWTLSWLSFTYSHEYHQKQFCSKGESKCILHTNYIVRIMMKKQAAYFYSKKCFLKYPVEHWATELFSFFCASCRVFNAGKIIELNTGLFGRGSPPWKENAEGKKFLHSPRDLHCSTMTRESPGPFKDFLLRALLVFS